MARISELHYSNAYAKSSGVSEFLEIALDPSEDPANFTASFYNANGSVGFEIPLTDPRIQVNTDPETGEIVYVLSNDDLPILLTDPDGSGSNNYEAFALTDTENDVVLDFYDIGGGTQNILAVDGAAAGSTSENLAVLVGPQSTTTSIQFNQPNPDEMVYATTGAGDTGVACFTAGTLIETRDGPKAIETLRPGDLVVTLDGGCQPLKWIGLRKVSGLGDLAPIEISAGRYEAQRSVRVSPQHRILVRGWQAELYFGQSDVFVPAKALVDGRDVMVAPCREVTYVHLLFERHQVVQTHGLWSESYHPACQTTGAWCAATAAELVGLFPELLQVGYGPLARGVAPAQLAQVLHAA